MAILEIVVVKKVFLACLIFYKLSSPAGYDELMKVFLQFSRTPSVSIEH